MIDEILHKAQTTHALTKSEIVQLLSLNDTEKLFAAADVVRKQFVGDGVYLRALIEFSNYCKNNCLYCGIRAGNTSARRYRLTPMQIVQTAQKAAGYGYKTIVLQSGEDVWFSTEALCEIIREIKKLDVALTLSIGEKSREEYKA